MNWRRLSKCVAVALSIWALLFAFFGIRRWFCWPWNDRCWPNFWSTVEASVLLLWVEDRETLISAFIAIGAATLGAYYLQRQIDVTQAADRERGVRRLRAVKATFPLTLSSICDFATASALEWRRLRDEMQHRSARAGGLNPDTRERVATFPQLQNAIVTELSAMIEASSEAQAAPIIAILNELQVRVSRNRDFAAEYPISGGRQYGTLYANGEVVEAAELYARASGLFEFARGEADPPSADRPSADAVRSALRLMGFHLQDPQLEEVVARRFRDAPLAAD